MYAVIVPLFAAVDCMYVLSDPSTAGGMGRRPLHNVRLCTHALLSRVGWQDAYISCPFSLQTAHAHVITPLKWYGVELVLHWCRWRSANICCGWSVDFELFGLFCGDVAGQPNSKRFSPLLTLDVFSMCWTVRSRSFEPNLLFVVHTWDHTSHCPLGEHV